MKIYSSGLRYLIVVALVALVGLAVAACSPADSGNNSDRELMDVPAVGDIYAAELTQFSSASFEDQDAVFGLMKVVAVEPGKIFVITEDAASHNKSLPRKEILGDLSGITFDENERIEIVHAELVKAYESGKIFAVRR